jgi:hypothetical protein
MHARQQRCVCHNATSQNLRSVCFLSQKFTAALSSLISPTQTTGRMSEQPPYVAFVQLPASAPSSGGSSRHHDECDLQVQVGARIERQEERVDWSVSPFVVTALMPRDAGNKGLRIGDRILSINGESVTHMPTSGLSRSLTGPLGSSVDIVVDRATCTPQPLALSVPRSSIEEHIGGKVFRDGEVIFQGWIAKDGRFSSAFKRRWARLSVRIDQGGFSHLTGSFFPSVLRFQFSWGEIGSAGFVESGSVCFKAPADAHSVSVTPLDHPPHGQQLPAPSSIFGFSNFGFNLHIGGRAINIFLDSQHSRDVWLRVLGMAQRTPEMSHAYAFPGSIVTCNHPSPWITVDVEMSGASIAKIDEMRLARLFLESKEREQAQTAAAKEEAEMRDEQIAAQQERDRLQLQHISACGSLAGGDVAALLHTTVARLHALERQNAMLHKENRAQNAIINQFAAQMKQNQLQSALLFRQLAQALWLGDQSSFRSSKQADKFAVSILTDVLGAQHQHTVTASQHLMSESGGWAGNGVSKQSSWEVRESSVEALSAFVDECCTTTASSVAACARQLQEAARGCDEVFQLQQQHQQHQ